MRTVLILLLMLLSTPVYATNWCDSSAGCWLFDESSGDLIDSSPNGNDGTLNNGPTQGETGQFGSAYLFDGSDDYVEVSPGNDLDFTDYSMTIWINSDTTTQSAFAGVYAKRTTGTNGAYSLQAGGDGDNLNVFHGGSNASTSIGLETDLEGSFGHCAVVFDDTANLFIFYHNGVEVENKAFTTSPGTGTGTLIIGNERTIGQPYSGYLDELAFFGSKLSATDINDIMDNGLVQDGAVRRFISVTGAS